MILVLLGTQDKPFPRLLRAIQDGIDDGLFHEQIVVQAGRTSYSSANMRVFDFVSEPELNRLIEDASLVITHAGVGSIVAALKKGKTVIAAARLKRYGEHVNDHQVEIRDAFEKAGYIIALKDFDQLGNILQRIGEYRLQSFVENNQRMLDIVMDYIDRYCRP